MPRINLKLVVAFYSMLMGIAILWSLIRGDSMLLTHPDFQGDLNGHYILRCIGLGVSTAMAVVILSRLAAIHFEWARLLEAEFAALLGPLNASEIVLISLFSGIAEEAFFRGAMQPTLGLFLTTIIFGILHIGPKLIFLPWTVTALVLGGILGWYFEITGTLIAPVTCHVLINLVNLSFIRRVAKGKGDAGEQSSDSS